MGKRTDQLKNTPNVSRMGCDDAFALCEQLEKELDELCDAGNTPRKYVTFGGITYCIYGTSSIAAFNLLNQNARDLEQQLWEIHQGG